MFVVGTPTRLSVSVYVVCESQMQHHLATRKIIARGKRQGKGTTATMFTTKETFCALQTLPMIRGIRCSSIRLVLEFSPQRRNGGCRTDSVSRSGELPFRDDVRGTEIRHAFRDAGADVCASKRSDMVRISNERCFYPVDKPVHQDDRIT